MSSTRKRLPTGHVGLALPETREGLSHWHLLNGPHRGCTSPGGLVQVPDYDGDGLQGWEQV